MSSPQRDLSFVELSRDELYEKVWSLPGSKLAKQFGISDVALAKVCKKFGIPRPDRGYWARLEAGQTLSKPPLSPSANPSKKIRFDVKANEARRAEWAIPEPKRQEGTMETEIQLSTSVEKLHPQAKKIQTLMEGATVDETGRVKIEARDIPKIIASPGQADRIAQALHVLIERLALLGVALKDGNESKPTLLFTKKEDYLTVQIEEEIEEIERPVTVAEKRRPSWTWNNKSNQPSGKLTFRLDSNHTLSGRRYWSESKSKPLEETLVTVIDKMNGLFQKFEQDRISAIQRQQEWEAAEKRRKIAEAQSAHRKAIDDCADERAQNLARASEWWRLHQEMEHFIEECEKRWKEEGKGLLEPAQEAWLTWARNQANRSSPFALGYPDPLKDGPIDEAAIPFGGPYPKTTPIPDPPSLQPKESSSQPNYYAPQPSKPYPFWLKYPKH